jgi:glycosyltransferase involved in cell wall biosynthesis
VIVALDNVDLASNSGPNSFGRKLVAELQQQDVQFFDGTIKPTVQLSFIQRCNYSPLPTVLRLDGIYFNTAQDWEALNHPIAQSYHSSDAVIVQSCFNKELIEKYFGEHKNLSVIRNGTDLNVINSILPLEHPKINEYAGVWACASTWRPHKRLGDNIKYFLEYSQPDECLIVCGRIEDSDMEEGLDLSRVFFVGELDWKTLVSIYKKATHFIHLAWLDHCPNVVVDARAAGCNIICSSTGGTREIAGPEALIIKEDVWDLKPTELYKPPLLKFDHAIDNHQYDYDINIQVVAQDYLNVLSHLSNGEF